MANSRFRDTTNYKYWELDVSVPFGSTVYWYDAEGVKRPLDLTTYAGGVFLVFYGADDAANALQTVTLNVLTDAADLVTDSVSAAEVAAKISADVKLESAKVDEGGVYVKILGKDVGGVFHKLGQPWEARAINYGPNEE